MFTSTVLKIIIYIMEPIMKKQNYDLEKTIS